MIGESAGTKAYIKNIILNPKGRTYLMYKGKPVNKELYGDWKLENGKGGSISYEENHVKYESNEIDAVSGACLKTTGKIDLTNYTTLYLQVSFGKHKYSNSLVNLKILDGETANTIIKQISRSDIQGAGWTMSIDISDLKNVSYPIEVSLDGYEDVRIYNMWLE